MPHDLPLRANLEHLRNQAKALLREYRQQAPGALERFRAAAHRPSTPRATLSDAQHVVAREYGLASWPKLKAHVESLAREPDPRRALVEAVQANDVERTRGVLSRHPGLRARLDEPMPELPFGSTLLGPAVHAQNREMVDLLVGAGADINARSHWWAGGFGVLDVCEPALAPFLIHRGATVDAHAAARLGMLDVLERLVAADPGRVHARGGDGQTPLHFAATVQVARYLLDQGAELDARDLDHESTPAQHMVRDRREVARFLVGRGCHTDLLMAAALGDLELVRTHLAADPACIRTRGSDVYFPMRDPRAGGHIYRWTIGGGKTAHVVARELGHEEIFALLMEHSPDELRLALACELGDEHALAALLRSRPGLARTLSPDDQRRLAEAAEDNDAGTVRLMLAAGWPVDARGSFGATPLHFAAWLGNPEMVREILRHHPPVEARSEEFDGTPLHWALHGSENSWRRDAGDYATTVELLLQAGATPPPPGDGLQASEPVRAVLRRQAGPVPTLDTGPPRG